jgi:predicted lipoprotein with Yx(FWY)xxD motif
MQKKLIGMAVGTAIGLTLAGCGVDKGTATPTTQTPQQPVKSVDLKVSNTTLGNVLTDKDGRTLYLFTKDTPGNSTCYDTCATAWPAVTVDDLPVASGVDSSILGTTARKDGSMQVTVKGMPLYRFASDAAAGDVKGQGNKGVWFVVNSNGDAVRTAAAASTTTAPVKTTTTVPSKSSGYSYGSGY